ncbi:MAG: SH3 domain-containing protein [bacterium]|nr:MAG: SH3 domain-containing protein [bacterium]
MKKIALILAVINLCIYFTCIADARIDKKLAIIEYLPDFEHNATLYVWLSNLRLREKPNPSSKVIDQLQFADKVVYLNEISNIKSQLLIRGIYYNAPWIKIKTKERIIGWVYSVGVKTEFIKIYTEHGYPKDQTNIAHIYENLSPFIPNDKGNKLVATGTIINPNLISKAIYGKDKVVDIMHIGDKKRTGDKFFSFERAEGLLYKVLGNQKVSYDGLVIDDKFIENREPIYLTYLETNKSSKTYKDLKSRIERLKKWKIDDLWIKYADKNKNYLAIVLHEKYKGFVMLSVVLSTPETVIFHDHIAEYKEGDDLFRVDDMGEFDPINISFNFLFKTKNEYELVYEWLGAEGRNIYIVRQNKDRFILGRRIYQPISY